MSLKPTIRQATANDLPRIREIINLSFPRFFRFFASRSVSDLNEPTLISEVEKTITGFAKLIEFSVGSTKCGCILWIAVHPAHRQRGTAFVLTNAGVAYLKTQGAGMIFASTQRRNGAALATLGKAGFRRMGFLGLWRLFSWRVFGFFSDIWLAPGEVVLLHQ